MKRVIICEGKTDAILVSYFLKKFGWIHIKDIKKPNLPVLPFDRDNEVLNWYRHPEKLDQELAIWGAGGIDQISAKLGHVIGRTREERTPSKRFEHVLLLFDRNNRSEIECKELVEKWATDSGVEIVGAMGLHQWSNVRIELRSKTPKEYYELRILCIVLPPDTKGNLEIFLTDSIRNESEQDRYLVDKAQGFIKSIPDEPYLNKTRYRPKACLGAILSVMSPDWVFSELHERLTLVRWEEIRLVETVYEKLSEL